MTGLEAKKHQDAGSYRSSRSTASSLRLATIRIRKSSKARSISTNAAISKPNPIPRAPISQAFCLWRRAGSRYSGRRSRPPVAVAWPRSKRNAGSSIDRRRVPASDRKTNGSSHWLKPRSLVPRLRSILEEISRGVGTDPRTASGDSEGSRQSSVRRLQQVRRDVRRVGFPSDVADPTDQGNGRSAQGRR